MLPTFPYTAMTITGIMHILCGVTVFINSCVGLGMKYRNYYEYDYYHNFSYRRDYPFHIFLGLVLGSSLWMIMVGVLGILTGKKREEDRKTHNLKIGYMVTAILSAVIFSTTALSFSSAINIMLGAPHAIGIIGVIASFANFVLSIVSSSICCCCANSTANTPGVVYVQNQAPPGNYPIGTYQPGTYPPGPYAPTAYPPGQYPAVQTYTVLQSPPDGVVNPGYDLNPPPPSYPTKNEPV